MECKIEENKEFCWTHEEIDLLYELYPTHPLIDITKQIGRSIQSIYNKACSLNLKRNNPTKWTHDEDLLLCQLRKDNYSMQEIVDIMGRSKDSIKGRLNRKGYTLHPLEESKIPKIRDMEAYSYVKWKNHKVTPISEEILNTWTKRKKQRDWEHGQGKLFYIAFKQWQKGKVSPINDETRLRFEAVQFRQCVFKSYGIGKGNGKYTIHHLFPQSIFPYMRFDVNNVIPLKWPIHHPIHKKYSNLELAIDPITPIIEALELSIMEAK